MRTRDSIYASRTNLQQLFCSFLSALFRFDRKRAPELSWYECCVACVATQLPERHHDDFGTRSSIPTGSFGARLRELRLQRGWTLQELAGQSGLSKTFLSRLESGGRQASIAAVLTLSRIFDVSLALLFESQLATEPCVIVRGAEAGGTWLKRSSLCSAFQRRDAFSICSPCVCASRFRAAAMEHYHHDGEEWIYVLSGALTLSLAGKTYDLECGDAAHFDSRLPHRLIARGARDAEVLLVASPLSGRGNDAVQRPPASRDSRVDFACTKNPDKTCSRPPPLSESTPITPPRIRKNCKTHTTKMPIGKETTAMNKETQLRPNCLNFIELLAQNIALISPTMTAALIVPLMFSNTGNISWLSYAVGTVMLLFVAFNLNQFAKRTTNAGSMYSYASAGLGFGGGSLCGWCLVWAYLFIGLAGTTGFTIFASKLLEMIHCQRAARLFSSRCVWRSASSWPTRTSKSRRW